MSEKLLRKTIRSVILEVWKMPDELEQKYSGKDFAAAVVDDSDKGINIRGLGIQSQEVIRQEREYMKQFSDKLNTTKSGRYIRDQFMKGNIVCAHSIEYEGWHSKKRVDRIKPFSDWMHRFAKNNKNQISCIAYNGAPGSAPNIRDWDSDINNVEEVFNGIGFLMKGYPAYISLTDELTQTLSSIHPDLADHQKNSGIAKRVGSTDNMIDFDNFGGSDEVILDNWAPIGIFIGYDFKSDKLVHQDAFASGLPVYHVNDKTKALIEITNGGTPQ